MLTLKQITRLNDMSASVVVVHGARRSVTGKHFLAGLYRIADMAVLPWIYRHLLHSIDLAEYPLGSTGTQT